MTYNETQELKGIVDRIASHQQSTIYPGLLTIRQNLPNHSYHVASLLETDRAIDALDKLMSHVRIISTYLNDE